MKETETTYYCDVTGDEIDKPFEMLYLNVAYSTGPNQLANTPPNLHLSVDAHDVEYPRCNDHEFTAYVDPDGDVCMIREESGGGRVWYYGRETGDGAIRDVLETVQSVLDGGSP